MAPHEAKVLLRPEAPEAARSQARGHAPGRLVRVLPAGLRADPRRHRRVLLRLRPAPPRTNAPSPRPRPRHGAGSGDRLFPVQRAHAAPADAGTGAAGSGVPGTL